MFGLGVPELLIILVLALLVFGPRKLPELGSFLGKSLRDFRESLEGDDDGESDTLTDDPGRPNRDGKPDA